MAVVKNLMVRAGADFSAITTQANKASRSMRGMQTNVSRSCNIMTKAVSGLKKVLGAIGVGLSVAALAKMGKEAAEAYDTQVQGEMKLATVMRKTMGASNAEIQSILDLTAAQQQLGVVGDEAQMAGAQQLSTYLHLTGSLKTLLPVMNDLAVQQYGLNVSEEQRAHIEEQWDLNKPPLERYLKWAKNALHGDLGRSISLHQPVSKVLAERVFVLGVTEHSITRILKNRLPKKQNW